MILIKDIEVVNCPDNIAEIYYNSCSNVRLIYESNKSKYVEIGTEIINGTIFKNVNGDTVVIGAAKDVQDALGLPFEVFEKYNDTINSLRSTISTNKVTISQLRGRSAMYQKRLKNFNSSSFFKRCMMVFFGI